MLRVSLNTLAQERTIRPMYADHQATPIGGFLDPAWTRAVDIYPGMVVTKTAGDNFVLYEGPSSASANASATNAQRPWGLSALFVAPQLGIDEVALSNTNLFTVWKGGSDAMMNILAPAFDTLAPAGWANVSTGARQPLGATTLANNWGAAPGLLTPWTATAFNAGYISEPFATLENVLGPTSIVITLDDTVNNWVITAANTVTQ